MPIDLCVEGYGAVIYVMDSIFGSGLLFGLDRTPRQPTLAPPFETSLSRVEPGRYLSVHAAVRAQAAELPFVQSQALWLVDVCGCSYEQAGIEAGVSRDEISSRVAQGRRSLRQALLPG